MSEFAEGYAVGMGNNNCNSGYGFGAGWGEWIWIIVLFALWQNGGFGFGGDRGNYATQSDVRAAVDQQTLISKLDQQTYGLADSTYALNNTIVNGFHGVDNAICNLGYNMQSCCCETQRAIEREACDTRHAIYNSTRDIIDNANANSRAILDAFTAQRLEAKDSKIAEQNQTIFGLQLAASQAAQNNYIIGQLRPAPVPAYAVANPYANYGFGCNPCGC